MTEAIPLIAAVLVLLAVLAFVIRMHALEKKLATVLARLDESRSERNRPPREKEKRDDVGELRSELTRGIDALRSAIGNVPAEVERRIARAPRETSAPRPASAYDTWEEPRGAEDGVAQLLVIANRIVQQSSTTLDAFRASAGSLASRVSPWPSALDTTPAAFVVEHRGSCYAVPNVVKPARLPQDWFNRPDFGVNDEIRRVVSLPRLRRRGEDYVVEDKGVFAR